MTRKGSDVEQAARILKRHDERITDLERRREVAEAVLESLQEENGILVETNVTIDLYEDDELVRTEEVHNLATDYCDEWLAQSMTGENPAEPSRIEFGTGTDINGDLTSVGSTPIVEAYVSGRDAVFVGDLAPSELNGYVLSELGVAGDSGLFNHAPIDPPIDKTEKRHANVKVRFLFLHE